ncbi:hypothetical protein B0T21DRAFT_173259 [Apiosordaria backusii]|uniref:Uncharacterized protein n=1 Tax=Apiosordaria backusii TaxID=314023 RepID=A0AA40BKY5_9PEZI|nr:hypothetical protein B0T21DRAFT_173259 [Apiosordaria backusii]
MINPEVFSKGTAPGEPGRSPPLAPHSNTLQYVSNYLVHLDQTRQSMIYLADQRHSPKNTNLIAYIYLSIGLFQQSLAAFFLLVRDDSEVVVVVTIVVVTIVIVIVIVIVTIIIIIIIIFFGFMIIVSKTGSKGKKSASARNKLQ